MRKLRETLSLVNIISLLIALSFPFIMVKPAEAANLSYASIRLNRMQTSFAASSSDPILVVSKVPSAAPTEANVKINFGTGNFTVTNGASAVSVTTTGIPSTYQGHSLTAWPSIGTTGTCTGTSATSVVTCASGDLTSTSNYYAFLITGGVSNPSSANQYTVTITTQTSVPADIDTSTVAVNVVTTGSDIVTVTATVPPSFNFALASNTLANGTLSTGSVKTAGPLNIDVDTNAGNGWVAWMKSANAALDSSSTGDSIATGTVDGSPDTASAGTNKYLISVNATHGTGSGTVSTAAEYAGNGTSTGGSLSTSYQEIATSTGTANNDNIALTSLVAIGPLTKAATDYSDTLTIIGAGAF